MGILETLLYITYHLQIYSWICLVSGHNEFQEIILNDHTMKKKEDTDVNRIFDIKTLSIIVTKICETNFMFIYSPYIYYFNWYLIMFSSRNMFPCLSFVSCSEIIIFQCPKKHIPKTRLCIVHIGLRSILKIPNSI